MKSGELGFEGLKLGARLFHGDRDFLRGGGVSVLLAGGCSGWCGRGRGFAVERGLQLVAEVANFGDEVAFFFPAVLQRLQFLFGGRFQRGDFRELLLVIGAYALFTIQNAGLHFERIDLAREVFDGRRRGVLAEGQAGACGIENTHRLVW